MKCEVIRRLSLDTIPVRNEVSSQIVMPKKEREEQKAEDDDYLVKTIGAFGVWQGVVSATVILTRSIAMWNMMSITFLTPLTEFVCVQFSDNVTFQVNKSVCYDTCLQYNYTSIVANNIIEDFELICDKAWLGSFMQSVLMFGLLIGSWLFGWISDRFSRRLALVLSTALNAVFMVALPFSPNYITFACIRFAIGLATGGSFLICVVHVMEIVGKRHREVAGACCLSLDGVAEASLAGFAYFTSSWKGYTMSYAVVACFISVLILFVPESPRWLVSNGRIDDAVRVITKAAKRNKLATSHIQAEITKAVEDMKLQDNERVKPTYLDFVNTKKSLLLLLIVLTIWFTMGICYYGIYQYVTIIGVDPYLTVIILGLIQVPLCPVGIVLNKTVGRKISTVGTTTLIGITMLCLIFVPKDHWLGIVLGMVGFAGSSLAFSISYVYVSELFPTPLRNMSYGLASGAAKIGAMVAPFAANLVPRWLPSMIFCICPFVAALSSLALEETRGWNLRDTIVK